MKSQLKRYLAPVIVTGETSDDTVHETKRVVLRLYLHLQIQDKMYLSSAMD